MCTASACGAHFSIRSDSSRRRRFTIVSMPSKRNASYWRLRGHAPRASQAVTHANPAGFVIKPAHLRSCFAEYARRRFTPAASTLLLNQFRHEVGDKFAIPLQPRSEPPFLRRTREFAEFQNQRAAARAYLAKPVVVAQVHGKVIRLEAEGKHRAVFPAPQVGRGFRIRGVITNRSAARARMVGAVEVNEDRRLHVVRAVKIVRFARHRKTASAQYACRDVRNDRRPIAFTRSAQVTMVFWEMRAALRTAFVARRNEHVVVQNRSEDER